MLLRIRVISRRPRANSRSNNSLAADVPLVAEELAEQLARQLLLLRRPEVADVAGREADAEKFAPVADDQVQLEAVEPPGGGLAASGQAGHDLVAVDPQVVADAPRRRGVDEADAAAGRQGHARLQVGGEGGEGLGDALDKAVVAQQVRELAAQVLADVPEVEVLERAVVGGVEEDQDRHDLAQAHAAGAVAVGLAVLQESASPLRLEGDGELVQVVEQCDDVHGRPPCWFNPCLVVLVDNKSCMAGEAALSITRLSRTHVGYG